MKTSCTSGFSMVELVTTLAVTGILLAVGVPSFLSAVKNSQLSAQYGEIVSALYLARSEAVKQNKTIAVCARNTDTSCGSSWNNGWLIFRDANGPGNTAGILDASDIVISINGPLSAKSNTLSVIGWKNGTASAVDQPYIQYNSSGASNWQGGTYMVCDDRGAEHALALNIALTGDIRKSRDGKDFRGESLAC